MQTQLACFQCAAYSLDYEEFLLDVIDFNEKVNDRPDLKTNQTHLFLLEFGTFDRRKPVYLGVGISLSIYIYLFKAFQHDEFCCKTCRLKKPTSFTSF